MPTIDNTYTTFLRQRERSVILDSHTNPIDRPASYYTSLEGPRSLPLPPILPIPDSPILDFASTNATYYTLTQQTTFNIFWHSVSNANTYQVFYHNLNGTSSRCIFNGTNTTNPITLSGISLFTGQSGPLTNTSYTITLSNILGKVAFYIFAYNRDGKRSSFPVHYLNASIIGADRILYNERAILFNTSVPPVIPGTHYITSLGNYLDTGEYVDIIITNSDFIGQKPITVV
jgi:hypothetical protein